MLLNRKQTGWVWTTLVLALLALAAYLIDPQAADRGHRGSNWVGLGLGAVALIIFIFCGMLSLKRKAPHWKIGRAQVWLQAHVWFGLLAVWLVALHSGFGLGGPTTTIIWILTALVTVSALVGLGLQQVTPRLLLHSVTGETVAQQLSRLLASVPSSRLELPPPPEPGKPAPWPKPPKAFDFTWEGSLQEMAFSTVMYYTGVDGSLKNPSPAWVPDAPGAAPAAPAAAAAVPKPAAPTAPAAPASASAPAPAPAPASVKPPPDASGPATTLTAAAAVAKAATPTPPAAAPAAPPAAPAPKPAPAPAPPKKDVPPNGGEPLRRFWHEIAAPYFEGQDSVLDTPGKSGSLLSALKTMTPAHIHPGVEGLAFLIDRRRQLIKQRHMQRVLISWLFVHVPLSWALLVLAIVHAVMATRWSEVSL
ncbi:MAG: hypothetical protein ACKVZJ_05005 [Phycisphaerales bacterium]